MTPPPAYVLRAILYALAGFSLWVVCDTCMKLAGEANVPSYQVVGSLGGFGALFMVMAYAPRGRIKELWPKKPWPQVLRSSMSFGSVMVNTVTLKHLPLTMFYIAVFTSPMVIALFAALLLRERLTWPMIAAILVGFAGVVIAINPWGVMAQGDWIGYVAATGSVLFFVAATLMMRFMTQSETPQSMTFMTSFFESIVCAVIMMFGHPVAVSASLFGLMAVMGLFNVVGNYCNCNALRYTNAATVEQFHYSQIIVGALLGYLIWHEVPTPMMIVGAVVIVLSGLYVAAVHHKNSKLDAMVAVVPVTTHGDA